MNLLERIYAQEPSHIRKAWEKFVLFHPDLRHLRHKPVTHAILSGDKGFFLRQIRNIYLPVEKDEDVQETFRQAMNRGIVSINKLCQQYLGEDYKEPFLMQEIPSPLNFFEFIREATEACTEARSGAHKGGSGITLLGLPIKRIDYAKILKAYNAVRSWGLGDHVLMIDESPEVIASLRNYPLVIDWFNRIFDFRNPVASDTEGFSQTWETNAGVRVYGATKPFSSRLKILDDETGKPKYASIIMKILIKQNFPEHIKDYTGIEFIVRSAEEQERLLHYFSAELRGTSRLESFKRTKDKKASFYSSQEFDCIKFLIRPPVPIVLFNGQQAYERVPVEVQMLTIEADRIRKQNPDATHEAYKKRQFFVAFPILFPREIYEPLLKAQ